MLVLAKQFGDSKDDVVLVRRDDVHRYTDDESFRYYLAIYHYTKLWGMPNGNGWANEDTNVLDAITALEIEQREIESDEMEKSNPNKKGGNGSGIDSLRRQ